MYVLARRFTILTLIMTVFAIGMTAIVNGSAKGNVRYHIGTTAPCLHPASINCTLYM